MTPQPKMIQPKSNLLPKKAKFIPYPDDASGLPIDASARPLLLTPIEKTIANLLKIYAPQSQDAIALQSMIDTWPTIAGDLATRLSIERFEKGILYVKAKDSAELFEIRRTKLRSLEKNAKSNPNFSLLRQIRIIV